MRVVQSYADMKWQGLQRGLRLFLRDISAIGAVEFALIFPVMMTIYFGVAELTNALIAQRRVTNVAQTAGDLVAQAASVTNSDMTDIFAASAAILQPFSSTPVTIKVSSVVLGSNGKATVAWSDGYHTSGRTVGSTVTLPTGLLTATGDTVIYAESTYAYVSPVVGQVLKSGISMGDQAFLKPRRSLSVARVP